MPKLKQLMESGEDIYPITSEEGVLDKNGINIGDKISDLQSNKITLRDYDGSSVNIDNDTSVKIEGIENDLDALTNEFNEHIFNHPSGGSSESSIKLLFKYIHSANEEIHISSLDLETGIYTTSSSHNLKDNSLLLIAFNSDIKPKSIPCEFFYTSNLDKILQGKVQVLNDNTFAIKNKDGEILTYANPNNTNINVSDWHFEIPALVSIENLNLKKFKIFIDGVFNCERGRLEFKDNNNNSFLNMDLAVSSNDFNILSSTVLGSVGTRSLQGHLISGGTKLRQNSDNRDNISLDPVIKPLNATYGSISKFERIDEIRIGGYCNMLNNTNIEIYGIGAE